MDTLIEPMIIALLVPFSGFVFAGVMGYLHKRSLWDAMCDTVGITLAGMYLNECVLILVSLFE